MTDNKLRIPGLLAAVTVAGLVLTGCASGNERIEDNDNTKQEDREYDAKESEDTDFEVEEDEFVEPDEQSAFDIKVGDCIIEPETTSENYETLEVVPCNQPHEYEVFYDFELTGSSYDSGVAESKIYDYCYGAPFEQFVGTPWDSSSLDAMYLQPTEESWAQGDRLVTCMVFEPGETNETVGSLEGVEA